MQQSEMSLKNEKATQKTVLSSGFYRKKNHISTSRAQHKGWAGKHQPPTAKALFQHMLSQAGFLQVTHRGSPCAQSFGGAIFSTALSSLRLLGLRTVPIPIKGRDVLMSQTWPLLQCTCKEKERPTLYHSSARKSIFKSLLD